MKTYIKQFCHGLLYLIGCLQIVHAQTDYLPVPNSSIDSQVYGFAQLNVNEFGNGFGSDSNPSGYGLNINLNDIANSPGDTTQTGCDDLYKLSYKVYDIDYDGEVRIYINNVYVAYILANGEQLTSSRKIEFCGSLLKQGNNLIEFRVENSNRVWGVKDVLLKYKIINSVNINYNTNADFAYGNGYGTNLHSTHIVLNFDETQNRSHFIWVSGWDIEQASEISVYFNDNFIGFLTQGCDRCLSETDIFELDGASMLNGRNQLVFVQQTLNEQWGITNLSLRPKLNPSASVNILLF